MTWYTLDENEQPVLYDYIEEAKQGRFLINADIWNPLKDDIDGFHISTVFLGLDHQFMDGGRPILWETMIFDRREIKENYLEDYCDRYTSGDEARAGHETAKAWVREQLTRQVTS